MLPRETTLRLSKARVQAASPQTNKTRPWRASRTHCETLAVPCRPRTWVWRKRRGAGSPTSGPVALRLLTDVDLLPPRVSSERSGRPETVMAAEEGQSRGGAPLPVFFSLPFISGVDLAIPASRPPDGRISVRLRSRGFGRVRAINTRICRSPRTGFRCSSATSSNSVTIPWPGRAGPGPAPIAFGRSEPEYSSPGATSRRGQTCTHRAGGRFQ